MDYSELNGIVRQHANEVKTGWFANIAKLKANLVKWSKFDIPVEPHLPVNRTHVSEICLAYNEVKNINGLFTKQEQDALIAFCRQVAKKVQDNYSTAQHSTIINNFQSHRIKMLASAATALNDINLMNTAEKWLLAHLDNNLLAGGLCLEFKDRDSIKYVSYNLEPLLIANGLMLKMLGRNHFLKKNNIGVCLKDAVKWMHPYVFGIKQNIMLLKSIYESDSANPDYNKLWQRSFATNVIHLAIRYDAEFISWLS